MMKLLIKLIVLFLIFTTNLYAVNPLVKEYKEKNTKTVTVKCYIDEEHSYSFLLNIEEKNGDEGTN